MKELFRDTVIGHLIRLVTKSRWLQHAEDRDPSLWHMYVSTEKSSKFSSHGTLEPLTKPKHHSVGASNTPTPQSEKGEYSYATEASNTPRSNATPVRNKSYNPDAIMPIGGNGDHSEKNGQPASSKSMATQDTDKGGQSWVTGAIGKEGMDVSMAEGQVNGDPALQMSSETNEKAWNAVQLEAGQEGIAAPEEAKKDPGKGRVVNVVVWFGPMDPEVSGLPCLVTWCLP